jgi:hypothetical protein
MSSLGIPFYCTREYRSQGIPFPGISCPEILLPGTVLRKYRSIVPVNTVLREYHSREYRALKYCFREHCLQEISFYCTREYRPQGISPPEIPSPRTLSPGLREYHLRKCHPRGYHLQDHRSCYYLLPARCKHLVLAAWGAFLYRAGFVL